MRSWDTSALAKLYIGEPDSNVFRELAEHGTTIVISDIARLETLTVFHRREAEGVLSPGVAARLTTVLEDDVTEGRICTCSLDSEIEDKFVAILEKCFSEDPPLFVRTNDALHVATALNQGVSEFVSADLRQRAVAALMGLIVLP